MPLTRLHINVDHVATLRQARGTRYPDPVTAAALCELAGADGITVHLREDRRHIQDRDVRILRETVQTVLNLEMAASGDMIALARELRPDLCTLVPEKREERTTEGGLDVTGQADTIASACTWLKEVGIRVSLFIDPDPEAVHASARLGADMVELHTGDYALAKNEQAHAELERLRDAARRASAAGLLVAAGHGLDYPNVAAVSAIPEVIELNIGHSIVSRAVLVGMERAVRDMKAAMRGEQGHLEPAAPPPPRRPR
jgi:pyridoxine 5-phosphate synthase